MFKAIREAGDELHPAERSKKALSADCFDYLDAFRYLGASRKWTQVGPDPIPITEIEAYLRVTGVDDCYERAKYMRLIKQLDRLELEHIHEKSKASKSK